MRAEVARWGVPDCSSTILRRKVLSFLTDVTEPIVVIVGASGYGKTVAAAQYALSTDEPAVWLSIQGQVMTITSILREVGIALGLASRIAALPADHSIEDLAGLVRAELASLCISRVVFFFDDFTESEDSPIPKLGHAFIQILRPMVAKVVFTSRQLDHGPVAGVSFAVCDEQLLAFSESEVVELAAALGSDTAQLPGELQASCAGHAALLRMMLLTSSNVPSTTSQGPGLAALSLIESLVAAHLTQEQVALLELTCLLREGVIGDLDLLGIRSPRRRLESIAQLLPLLRLEHTGSHGQTVFAVHDLVADCVVHRMSERGALVPDATLGAVLRVLGSKSRWPEVYRLIELLGSDEQALAMLIEFGRQMMHEHRAQDVLHLINLVPLQTVMACPRCLFLWAQALHELGEVEDCLAKAAAAMRLAEHSEDWDTLGMSATQRIDAWLDQGKAQESIDCAESLDNSHLAQMSAVVRLNLLTSYATALGVLDRRDESVEIFEAAEAEASRDPVRHSGVVQRLRRVRAYLGCMWTGDYAWGVRQVSPLLNEPNQTFLVRQSLRGNLAWMLFEMGRLDRAESLLEEIVGADHKLLSAAYLPLLGLIRISKGDYGLGLAQLIEAQRAAASYGDEADLQINRLYQCAVERAAGQAQASLALAERSLESLSDRDFLGCLRLAEAEVAASLLALRSVAAARRWLEKTPDNQNKQHALAAAMVLAVADLREHDAPAAVARLRQFAPYIATDSGNWRMAMYARTFPELLGILARALGVENLPVHMLQMVLPEHVEQSLRVSKEFLDKEEWVALGERGLGSQQFKEFVDRNGRPICRVRLFGGLDVVVNERVVRERDWKKRKARLLFAMLVVKRGHDVPRDQLMEYLWPDLDEERAKNNFYVAWSTMKSALQGGSSQKNGSPYVESSRGRCRILVDSVRSDIDEFEDLLRTSRDLEEAGRPDEAIRHMRDLMSVYRGDLLPGDVYDDWFSGLRDKYRFEFVDAMLRAVELLLEKDDPCEALLFARRALSTDPFREDLYQAALRCHLAAGQRSAAIETFIQCKTQLAEELGLDPGSETMALYQQILSMEERPRFDSYGLS